MTYRDPEGMPIDFHALLFDPSSYTVQELNTEARAAADDEMTRIRDRTDTNNRPHGQIDDGAI